MTHIYLVVSADGHAAFTRRPELVDYLKSLDYPEATVTWEFTDGHPEVRPVLMALSDLTQ